MSEDLPRKRIIYWGPSKDQNDATEQWIVVLVIAFIANLLSMFYL